jgi:hypothetical protein
MEYLWHDLLGNIGVILVLGAYLLLQLGRLRPEQLVFSFANGLGAALILVSLSVDFNMSAFIIEAAWLVISVAGIGLFILRTRKQDSRRNR